jgi:hypothetical protein
METTWLVMCPDWKNEHHFNKAQGWSLSKCTLKKVGQNYSDPLIECISCGKSFSLKEGLTQAFVSDVDFAIHHFRCNTEYSGTVLIKACQIETIMFPHPFESPPNVYLTPHGPIHIVPGNVTVKGFNIFSGIRFGDSDAHALKECKVNWSAFGNSGEVDISTWRRLLASSKNDQLRKDFRLEIVNLESCFEVFVSDYLRPILINKGIRKETVQWMLKHRIDLILSVAFREATGQTISQIFPDIYRRWSQNVKELRDSVIHEGVIPTEKQTEEACEIIFKFIMAIDPSIIEELKIRLENVREDRPNMVFGTATIKAGSKEAKVVHGLGREERITAVPE